MSELFKHLSHGDALVLYGISCLAANVAVSIVSFTLSFHILHHWKLKLAFIGCPIIHTALFLYILAADPGIVSPSENILHNASW